MDAETLIPTLIEQGKNTLKSMNNLKRKANRKGDQRASLYENYRANEHSFRVYTYANPDIGETAEVQAFLERLESFGELFMGVDTEHDTDVDSKQAKELYTKASDAYDEMVEKLKHT